MHGVPLGDGFLLKFSEVRHASFDVIAFDDRVCSLLIKLVELPDLEFKVTFYI